MQRCSLHNYRWPTGTSTSVVDVSPTPSWIGSCTPRIGSSSHRRTQCEKTVRTCPMTDSLISNHTAYVASLRCCPSCPDRLSALAGMRSVKSAPSRDARAQSSSRPKCPSNVSVPRCTIRTSRSRSGENCVGFLKSCQKSRMALQHSSSLALTVKVRFT